MFGHSIIGVNFLNPADWKSVELGLVWSLPISCRLKENLYIKLYSQTVVSTRVSCHMYHCWSSQRPCPKNVKSNDEPPPYHKEHSISNFFLSLPEGVGAGG